MDNQKIVERINTLACQIIEKGGGVGDLLVGLIDYTNEFYQVIKTSSKNELDRFCDNYPGFNHYANALNDIEKLCSDGKLRTFLELNDEKIQKKLSNSTLNSDKKYMAELQEVMKLALLQMHSLVTNGAKDQTELLPNISIFLLSVISTAADLAELTIPGGSASIYAEVESGVKNGGIRSIAKAVIGSYSSVSIIDSDDPIGAMQYLGQQLMITLTKVLHELPMPLRTPETQLRGIEMLLANFLTQKFSNPLEILDDFRDHVQIAVGMLEKKTLSPQIH